MAEWPNVPDSKSGVPQGTVGSNPTLSANLSMGNRKFFCFPHTFPHTALTLAARVLDWPMNFPHKLRWVRLVEQCVASHYPKRALFSAWVIFRSVLARRDPTVPPPVSGLLRTLSYALKSAQPTPLRIKSRPPGVYKFTKTFFPQPLCTRRRCPRQSLLRQVSGSAATSNLDG